MPIFRNLGIAQVQAIDWKLQSTSAAPISGLLYIIAGILLVYYSLNSRIAKIPVYLDEPDVWR